MADGTESAAGFGLLSCGTCGVVSRPARGSSASSCPRCGGVITVRCRGSIARSAALLLAAAILYVPANLLPIMETSSLTGARSDTIMSGIISLWSSGSWGIAIIVFIASITVPLLKFMALSLLLFAVRRRPGWRPEQLTRLYRLLELVGRWSMLDIFVVGLLITVVQFKTLAVIRVGPAAFPFAAVVVLTMLAAMQFDPRLIWDGVRKESFSHD